MIVINLSVTVLISPEHLEHQLSSERVFRQTRAISQRDDDAFRAKVEDFRRGKVHVSCDHCHIFEGWYETTGRARMGLSAHQRYCKKG